MIVTGFHYGADLRSPLAVGWLGHKDGGILIGKVCGHLLDEHRRKMAAKLTIGAVVTDVSKQHTARDRSKARPSK